MKGAYRAAIVCGLLPLVVGTSIFLLWVVTRWEWLMGAGLFALFFGLALFAVGVLALARYCWVALRMPEPPPRPWLKAALAAILLLSNFPAAGTIIWKVDDLCSRYTVVVRNGTGAAIEDVRVSGGGCEAVFGAIAPGDEVRRSFLIQCDGTLEIRAQGLARQPISGYVTNGLGGHTTVTVHPDGTVTAEDRD
ncbi:MAG TPA: hypothetical protein VFY93_14995 [Planctomycetota bacterium]|nr:hypothetical protein [Planctomycetota bacterium]